MCLSSLSHLPTHLRMSQHGFKAVNEFSKTPHHAPRWLADYWHNWKLTLQGAFRNVALGHKDEANVTKTNKKKYRLHLC